MSTMAAKDEVITTLRTEELFFAMEVSIPVVPWIAGFSRSSSLSLTVRTNGDAVWMTFRVSVLS